MHAFHEKSGRSCNATTIVVCVTCTTLYIYLLSIQLGPKGHVSQVYILKPHLLIFFFFFNNLNNMSRNLRLYINVVLSQNTSYLGLVHINYITILLLEGVRIPSLIFVVYKLCFIDKIGFLKKIVYIKISKSEVTIFFISV